MITRRLGDWVMLGLILRELKRSNDKNLQKSQEKRALSLIAPKMTENVRSPAVKRLMRELAELQSSPSPEFTAAPLDSNIFEWHFTIRGPPQDGFQGGRYHGRLVFPSEYPFKVSKSVIL